MIIDTRSSLDVNATLHDPGAHDQPRRSIVVAARSVRREIVLYCS